jgi:hypothetical protein
MNMMFFWVLMPIRLTGIPMFQRNSHEYGDSVSPECRYQLRSLQGVKAQNIILTAMRTSNITCDNHPITTIITVTIIISLTCFKHAVSSSE